MCGGTIFDVPLLSSSAFNKQVRGMSPTAKGKKDMKSYRNKPVNYVSSERIDSRDEFYILSRNDSLVNHCTWYYPECSSSEARKLLKSADVGTFLLRNSSDPKCLFSLSVKTQRGPTSVRIKYSGGLFQLDCEDGLSGKLPKFENVVALVNFHSTLSKNDKENKCLWLEPSGKKSLPVLFHKPKLRKPDSLKHLARIAVNACQSDIHIPEISTDLLPIPQCLKLYLREYIYRL
ncbi:suppressor of cytokine signaling 2 [Patella vulgata]|uniref:suppressor of cytokine signaling 2 n=1 Tax=Patella vulgata TaxID=6465 RepID=UPI002180863C|nr:suppressor of cytokine signaling 2 [Patella vulgata]